MFGYQKRIAERFDGTTFPDDGMTQQEFKEDCDIPSIVNRAINEGIMPIVSGNPVYGDFSEVTDYKSALDAVIAANNAFMELPVEIRDIFGNNPEKFIAFVSDEKNKEEAVKMGLIAKPIEQYETKKTLEEIKQAVTKQPENSGTVSPT